MAGLLLGKGKKGEEKMQKAIKKYFPVFVLPTMIAFTIGFVAPFLLGIYLSFCKFTTVTDADFIGLGNLCEDTGGCRVCPLSLVYGAVSRYRDCASD